MLKYFGVEGVVFRVSGESIQDTQGKQDEEG